MVMAVLQVGAEGGQQLDAVGGHILGAPLLQVGEAHALVCPALQSPHHHHINVTSLPPPPPPPHHI